MTPMRRYQRGFTLTEMAIVVVLGGILLAAGLMAGRGQISRAQAQDVIQVVGDLQVAAASFKQRYGYLPGDWIFVANQLPGVTAGGNGDGLIAGTITGGLAQANSEVQDAPLHLYAAGLIGKVGTNVLQRVQTQFGSVHMAVANNANTTAGYVAANLAVRNAIVLFNLPCEVVLDLDRAMDDGDTATGKVQVSPACVAGGTATRTFVPL